jgi:hypothetical protein
MHYTVYGEGLASSVSFPELPERGSRDARWTFETVADLDAMSDASELGSDLLYADVHARLHQHATGHRIIVDDTGSFDLSADRRHVRCVERPDAWPDFVRAHLMGRVLATSLYLDGLLPLHASAVETRDGVVAFLAPKGFGKSTLALALVTAGARLGTDDTLPIEPLAVPQAWPGVHSIRVHEDALDALDAQHPELETREGKRVVTALPGERLQVTRRPLAAVYLLDPVGPEVVDTTRTAMPPMLAAVGVVAHVKIGRMLGAAAAAPMLERAAAIVRRVPVFRLHAPRDLARLHETAGTIIDWHGVPTA